MLKNPIAYGIAIGLVFMSACLLIMSASLHRIRLELDDMADVRTIAPQWEVVKGAVSGGVLGWQKVGPWSTAGEVLPEINVNVPASTPTQLFCIFPTKSQLQPGMHVRFAASGSTQILEGGVTRAEKTTEFVAHWGGYYTTCDGGPLAFQTPGCVTSDTTDIADIGSLASSTTFHIVQATVSGQQTLCAQFVCPSGCAATVSGSINYSLNPVYPDSGPIDSGGGDAADAADAADANDGSDAGPPPGAMTVSQTGISPLQTTTNGPLAGSQALTFTIASNASTVTSCAVCGVNVTSLSCGSSTCTGSSASLTGVNAGAAQLCNATCTNPGGTTTCTNCYFALPACAVTNLRGDALVLSGSTILGAVNLAGGVQWDAGGSPTVVGTSVGSLNGQQGIHTVAPGSTQDLFGPSLSGIDGGSDIYVWSPNTSSDQCHGTNVMGTSGVITCFQFSGAHTYDDNLATTRHANGTAITLVADAGYVFDFESTSALWSMTVNGTVISSTATNTVAGPTNPSIGNAASGQNDDETWGEKLTTTCPLSAADLTALKAYNNFRYGLNFN